MPLLVTSIQDIYVSNSITAETSLSAAEASLSAYADEELVQLYQESGDRGVFESLMRRYQREIYSYLRRYVGNAEMAEDAFQGTFLQVHLKCSQFDPERRFRPWLYAIATNQAIDVQRRNKRHRMASLDRTAHSEDGDGNWSEKLVGEAPDPLAEASVRENGEWIRSAVDDLSDSMKRVVQLVYYQGMKYREAADVLGIPVGTVKSRLHAAVQRLSLQWDETHDEAMGES